MTYCAKKVMKMVQDCTTECKRDLLDFVSTVIQLIHTPDVMSYCSTAYILLSSFVFSLVVGGNNGAY